MLALWLLCNQAQQHSRSTPANAGRGPFNYCRSRRRRFTMKKAARLFFGVRALFLALAAMVAGLGAFYAATFIEDGQTGQVRNGRRAGPPQKKVPPFSH